MTDSPIPTDPQSFSTDDCRPGWFAVGHWLVDHPIMRERGIALPVYLALRSLTEWRPEGGTFKATGTSNAEIRVPKHCVAFSVSQVARLIGRKRDHVAAALRRLKRLQLLRETGVEHVFEVAIDGPLAVQTDDDSPAPKGGILRLQGAPKGGNQTGFACPERGQPHLLYKNLNTKNSMVGNSDSCRSDEDSGGNCRQGGSPVPADDQLESIDSFSQSEATMSDDSDRPQKPVKPLKLTHPKPKAARPVVPRADIEAVLAEYQDAVVERFGVELPLPACDRHIARGLILKYGLDETLDFVRCYPTLDNKWLEAKGFPLKLLDSAIREVMLSLNGIGPGRHKRSKVTPAEPYVPGLADDDPDRDDILWGAMLDQMDEQERQREKRREQSRRRRAGLSIPAQASEPPTDDYEPNPAATGPLADAVGELLNGLTRNPL